ncbi:hypothetical protein LCA12A_2392 [Lacticaseibacillus casei 12A]|nr:hypothetical protein LCA12A_2392 [Lacticaseibacillus casei 12A]
MPVITIITTITACVGSLVVLIIVFTRLIKATTMLLLAVHELMQALEAFREK